MNIQTTSASEPSAIVLLGHGSRDPLWHGPMLSLAERLQQRAPAITVRCAYLEWTPPGLIDLVDSLVSQGHVGIRLLPLFLGMGKHAREDLPALTQQLSDRYPQLRLEVLPSAGETGALLDLLAELALAPSHPRNS